MNSHLLTKIRFLPAIGPHRAQLLERLGVSRAVDLLFLFPRDYECFPPLQDPAQFVENERVSFLGTVKELDERVTRSGRHILGAEMAAAGGGRVRLLWFNQPYRKNSLRPGQRLVAGGVARSTVLHWEIVQPRVQLLDEDQQPEDWKPRPIYPLTEGLKQPAMRTIMRQTLPQLIPMLEEVLPDSLRAQLDVAPVADALRDVHFPSSQAATLRGMRRFKCQELLVLQLAIALQRTQRERQAKAPACPAEGKIHARILGRIGLQLTPDQQRSIDEIAADMASEKPMNRLLQGDVGSGKTVVAQYAMLLCVAHGNQAVLMAPTEVLARQHAATFLKSLAASRVRVGLLVGRLARRERNQLIEQVKTGDVDLVVGTQALLSEDIEFKQLGLVIVDEQHKFGVRQRAHLRTDQSQPHYLVLSATPIPRTIALTAFGDLDISTLRSKPPGRAALHTYVTNEDKLNSWWQFVARQLDQGRQAYIIAPRIVDDEASEISGAEGVFQRLQTGPLAKYRLGLLHGRLSSEAKESAMTQFVSGAIQVLVATTVVEVGIDVPNATVITILDADRLGLSQLHQLRGRVARGSHSGFACAVASARSEAADNERLQAFEQSNDGFELAEKDLLMRGPGDLLGTSQSGLASLRVANLTSDAPLVDLARSVARRILESDPDMSHPELDRLRRQTLKRYGAWMQLSEVG